MSVTGKISSFQSLGAVDGPGVRFVAFLQGCPLNCACCHNPETKPFEGGDEYTAEEIAKKVLRYREYFGKEGGITLSGGDPLVQPLFAMEILKECKENGIHTCIDTSGYRLDEDVKELLKYTDLVLLDIKYTDSESYRKYAGCDMQKPLEFLEYLEKEQIPVWIRQVIIPSLNDSKENILKLKDIVSKYSCVKKTELLPFRKICEMKYEKMGLDFPLKDISEPQNERMEQLKKLL